MTTPLLSRGPSLAELDERARDIFRRIVESYLDTGEPVGSRTLSRGGVSLSPASIRNTMQDLTQLGLLGAPHISAGRLPTHAGLRLFVDGLLEVGDVGEDERRLIETRLRVQGRSFEEALNEASSLLSGLAGGAGVVVTPVRDAEVKHVEFVALGGDQALAVMVFEDGVVENRLMALGGQSNNLIKQMNSERWVLKDHFKAQIQMSILDYIYKYRRITRIYVSTALRWFLRILSRL